ncbi:hypothetical protein DFJ74DRAFT_409163 [Hyaloraphidium curvatum]|nr:hypothetical protein DFJ74DRAFT_409163 [Hyaloraphidium curvatum]
MTYLLLERADWRSRPAAMSTYRAAFVVVAAVLLLLFFLGGLPRGAVTEVEVAGAGASRKAAQKPIGDSAGAAQGRANVKDGPKPSEEDDSPSEDEEDAGGGSPPDAGSPEPKPPSKPAEEETEAAEDKEQKDADGDNGADSEGGESDTAKASKKAGEDENGDGDADSKDSGPDEPVSDSEDVSSPAATPSGPQKTKKPLPGRNPEYPNIPVPLVDSQLTSRGIPKVFLSRGKADAPPQTFILDVGLNDGESLVGLKDHFEGDYDSAIRIGFECNPKWIPGLEKHARKHNYTLYNYCAWTEEREMRLWIDEHFEDSYGTSLLGSHSRAQKGKLRVVRALDFPSYLGELVRERDRVLVKMDVEGAEFRIARAMLVRAAPVAALDDPARGVPIMCLIDEVAMEEHEEEAMLPPSLRTVDRGEGKKARSRLKDVIEFVGDAYLEAQQAPQPRNPGIEGVDLTEEEKRSIWESELDEALKAGPDGKVTGKKTQCRIKFHDWS